ncbi:restriction endonuclease [Paracoccus sp. T5]|uniref:restriction endonuclease n=1 Tax=Paracoccus sp. T5 TaxID=3402161 RepID=UPI003ADCE995
MALCTLATGLAILCLADLHRQPEALLMLGCTIVILPGWVLRRPKRRRRRRPVMRRKVRAKPAAPPAVRAPRRRPSQPFTLGVPSDGQDFELWVARRLRQQGWRTRLTQTSGDQGIDIVATMGRTKVGIQCKRYTGSVGNKAVQEAIAGRVFHGLHVAAVVTTGTYTRSAEELARKAGIHLYGVGDIAEIRKLARKPS